MVRISASGEFAGNSAELTSTWSSKHPWSLFRVRGLGQASTVIDGTFRNALVENSLREGALEFSVRVQVLYSISSGPSANWWKLCVGKTFGRNPSRWWL